MTKRRGYLYGKIGCWKKGRLLEERSVAGRRVGCWKKGRLPEEGSVAGRRVGCWKKGRLPAPSLDGSLEAYLSKVVLLLSFCRKGESGVFHKIR
jgi:hypothetical protein